MLMAHKMTDLKKLFLSRYSCSKMAGKLELGSASLIIIFLIGENVRNPNKILA